MASARTWLTRTAPLLIIAGLLFGVVGLQRASDRYKAVVPRATIIPKISAATIRMVDFGLHLPIASLLWIDKRLDILSLTDTDHSFLSTIDQITGIDPQFSTPYAFSVLVMPSQRRCSYCISAALELGKRGVQEAQPDWRIPFYMAVEYFTVLKDKTAAAHYFDSAARSPDAPINIRTFSLNYNTAANERGQTRKIWQAIADSATDAASKNRAQRYLDRLDLFDLLEQATALYRRTFGAYPAKLSDLVDRHILPVIPADPFGYELMVRLDGTVGFVPLQ